MNQAAKVEAAKGPLVWLDMDQRALDDAVRFNQKLAAGLKTLRNMDEVDYGATDKEEIYRDAAKFKQILAEAKQCRDKFMADTGATQ